MKKNTLKIIFACSIFFNLSLFATSYDVENDKKMNISIYPLSTILGRPAVNAQFKITNNMTLGPVLSYTSTSSSINTEKNDTITIDATSYSVGGALNIYLNGKTFTDSWIVEFEAGLASATAKTNYAKSLTIYGAYAGAIGGYHWQWESGFSIDLGLGASYVTLNPTLRIDDHTEAKLRYSGILPTAKFTLGYSF